MKAYLKKIITVVISLSMVIPLPLEAFVLVVKTYVTL